MARYSCNMCKKPITFGVFQYSEKNFNQSLCMTCQDNIRRAKKIKEGDFEKFEERYLKCRRCGKNFSSPREKPYCLNCEKEMKEFQPNNPFSMTHRRSDSDISGAADSDHYD